MFVKQDSISKAIRGLRLSHVLPLRLISSSPLLFLCCKSTSERSTPLAGRRSYFFELYRVDDNGNVFVMQQFSSENDALTTMQVYEKRGHKQGYFVRKLVTGENFVGNSLLTGVGSHCTLNSDGKQEAAQNR